jgi:CBS domain-containing protein
MTLVQEYIDGGGGHFHPIEDLPVLEVGASVRDALAEARSKHVSCVLVRTKQSDLGILTLSGVVRALQGKGFDDEVANTEISAVTTIGILPHITGADELDGVRWLRISENASILAVAMVLDAQGNPSGILTQAEDQAAYLYTDPPKYVCEFGHKATPPVCEKDGSTVRLLP